MKYKLPIGSYVDRRFKQNGIRWAQRWEGFVTTHPAIYHQHELIEIRGTDRVSVYITDSNYDLIEFDNHLLIAVECEHTIMRTAYDTGRCKKCGEDFGWWCPVNKVCEYEDKAHDFCIHCGQPEERK